VHRNPAEWLDLWSVVKSFDSRVYSVNDYKEWEANGQLILSPRFQRREVWSDTARSYLMDTIVRGKPVPKIFLRQQIDPKTGRSTREVVDGQQRLRTILSYLRDGLTIRSSHNKDYGGLYFSQLEEDQRIALLSYELSTDLLINVSDSEVLDIFGRLNSHAVVLNEQEKINANHFGPFKRLADDLAHDYFQYWVENRILTETSVMRMADVSLTADLVIAMCEGIRSKKQIRAFYAEYEKDFKHDVDDMRRRFDSTLQTIQALYPEGIRRSEFRRVHLFYTLFTAIYEVTFGLPEFRSGPTGRIEPNSERVRYRLDRIDEIFAAKDPAELQKSERQFLADSRRATTDASVRERRTAYLVDLILDRLPASDR